MDETTELPAPGQPGAPSPEEWLAQANKPVPDGVRAVTQDARFDPTIDDEGDFE